ncbi:tripartite ATP-independent periplasmic transporter solute receptor, DctP family [Lachnospiraceae bacterium JC7]|nr:tripartite ATP-independent periplasmic transporter solute receptor, DctP family [Lachnospiraceae bacterium JC7]
MMKKEAKFYIILSVFMLTVALISVAVMMEYGGNSDQKDEKLVLRYGDVNPEGNITVESAHYFADRVNELSHGRIEIDIYTSGILGDELQSYQQLQMGALDFYRANGSSLSKLNDMEVSILSLPYLFRDREHFWKVCSGPIGDRILENIRESGSQMVGVFFLDEGVRNLMMAEEPVRKLSDMKGKRIRIMVSDILSDTISAFGASPVVTIYAELYNTLQKEEIDGAENPVSSYYSNKFYKVAPYYIKTGHMYAPSVVVMSEITWKHLSPEDREVIRKAAEMTEAYNQSEIQKAEDDAYSRLSQVEIIEPEDPDEWKAAVQPVYEKYGAGNEELIQEIRETK